VSERDDRQRAAQEVATQLSRRGVSLSGHESSEELADLLEAVERFEAAVERRGADLMVDEPVSGTGPPIAPDNRAFVLPRREKGESVAHFIGRLTEASHRV
jgi:hypothetical protein